MKYCEFCGKVLPIEKEKAKNRFCNNSCSAKWRVKTYGMCKISEDGWKKIKEANREFLKNKWKDGNFREKKIKEMKENNPMYNPENIKKSVQTRKQNGSFKNNFNNCGNGNISECEQIAYNILKPLGFEYNKAISTKTYKDLYPNLNIAKNYKPDFIHTENKIIIEIDGTNHLYPKGKELDEKKDKFFEFLGYKIYRFTNDLVKNNLYKFEREVVDIVNKIN